MYYFIPSNPNIISFLKNNNIKYKVDVDNLWNTPHLQFTLYKEEVDWSEACRALPKKNACWLVFSDKELDEAEWLTVRTTNMKVDTVDEGTYEYSCLYTGNQGQTKYAHHRKQVAPYECSPIKWKPNNHFYSPYSGGYETIFCDDFAKDIICNHALIGAEFKEIIWRKKNIPLPNAYQMIFPHIIPEEAFIIGEYATKVTCPMCGRVKYQNTQEFRVEIKRAFLDNSIDFYTTAEIFGDVRENYFLIASQRAYQTLKRENLIRNLKFEPVILHD